MTFARKEYCLKRLLVFGNRKTNQTNLLGAHTSAMSGMQYHAKYPPFVHQSRDESFLNYAILNNHELMIRLVLDLLN